MKAVFVNKSTKLKQVKNKQNTIGLDLLGQNGTEAEGALK
jgi:hypothetical protein